MHFSFTSKSQNRNLPRCFGRDPSGFTLIELIVVVAVIALITASIAPSVFSSMAATRITSAGETLASQISLGHQLAVAGNQEVEMRFYEYQDLSNPGTNTACRALVMVRAAGVFGGTASTALGQQLSDTYYLPSGLVISDNAKMSPALAKISSVADREGFIKKTGAASYKAFRFYPDGSTDMVEHGLVANQCYFTVAEERLVANGEIPKNFYAVQVDPNTGRTVTYRP